MFNTRLITLSMAAAVVLAAGITPTQACEKCDLPDRPPSAMNAGGGSGQAQLPAGHPELPAGHPPIQQAPSRNDRPNPEQNGQRVGLDGER